VVEMGTAVRIETVRELFPPQTQQERAQLTMESDEPYTVS